VRLAADGSVLETTRSPLRLSFPAPSPDGRTVGCIALIEGRPRLALPCGAPPGPDAPEAYGPLAFSRDGAFLYYATPNDGGTLDLWSRSLGDGRAERLTSFTRDTYAPSVTRTGDVLFKLQDYAVHVAMVPASGGPATLLASFQSETPSWHPGGRQIGITYGPWRRVRDDFRYPDIAQDVGVLSLDQPLPATAPFQVVSATSSEDQSVCWSPNGRFIALHSHYGPSDDIFLMPADLSRPPRQISTDGSETGWPRWSPDGRFVAFTTDVAPVVRGQPSWERPREQNGIILIGVDQATGEVREPQQQVALSEFKGQPLHAEWAPDSGRLFFDSNDGGDRRSLNVVSRAGGRVTRVHAFESEQGFSGIGVSPDGRSIAFVAPAKDGYYQIFVVPSTGGAPLQVTSDSTHKTQPSFSPDGKTIALTVWRYEELFFALSKR
jgi:Tol biopolymer transport system component